ncbi:MAG TPA: DegT/DnrJ/EryC1/StrS family aminotransferase [Pyrinomonadaceae bacterium]|nr:DegT/DnrJ/EryC1/StrS family aminotransferase [Pyrinomonadaceae bacterium]
MTKISLIDLPAQYATIRDAVRTAVDRVFESQHFVLGAEVTALEEEIARYCQTKFAIGCASGSDALLLALMTLGIGKGDEVITTPFTFFATASAITRLGARPVFVDIDERTFNIDPNLVESAITPRTKAIIPVHMYGQCADMDPLLQISEKTGILIIEDAAQAIGAEDHGRRAGSMGAMGCLSFYPSKNLGGAGDGGMVVTNSSDLAHRLQTLHVHGENRKYHHQSVGINSRLDALQAVVLRIKLPHLEDWIKGRQDKAAKYERMFAETGLTEQINSPFIRSDGRHVFHLFVIRVCDGRRDDLRSYLHEEGIGADVYYPVPLHLQECFAYLNYRKGELPIAERASEETLALPVYPELTLEQQERVVRAVADFF